MPTFLVGFVTSLTLIVAIGAQNAFVLRQGLTGRHVVPVVAVCAAADALLITAGIAGLGAAVTAHPDVLAVVRYGGAAFLVGYAALATARAVRPRGMSTDAGQSPGLRAALAACLAFTFLNPHVYLDTVVLLGSLANQHGSARWVFGAGAVAGSVVWFVGLGFGARWLGPLFARPGAWRVLDGVIATVMLGLGVALLVG